MQPRRRTAREGGPLLAAAAQSGRPATGSAHRAARDGQAREVRNSNPAGRNGRPGRVGKATAR
eukprot:11036650-Heterocapsa_arctica.AAC.1